RHWSIPFGWTLGGNLAVSDLPSLVRRPGSSRRRLYRRRRQATVSAADPACSRGAGRRWMPAVIRMWRSMSGSRWPPLGSFEWNHADLRSLIYARSIVRLMAPAMSIELERIELGGFPRFGGFSDWSEQVTASYRKLSFQWLPVLLVASLAGALIWFGSGRGTASEPTH